MRAASRSARRPTAGGSLSRAERERRAALRRTAREDLPTARERLLDAADELFYEEGIHTVGIDRVIERAGVAKATLYSTFGSKDKLMGESLEGRHARRSERISEHLVRFEGPRDRVLAVVDALGEAASEPGDHGCAFANASAESAPGGAVEQVTARYRTWIRTLFTRLAKDAGVRGAGAGTLARELQLLYDGAAMAARMDGDPGAAQAARVVAAARLDAARDPSGLNQRRHGLLVAGHLEQE